MPRKPMHPCKHLNCPNLTDGEYCAEHQQQHQGEYDRYCRRPGHDTTAYGSAWRKARGLYIKAHPLCERCLQQGRYVSAEIVHHKKPIAYGGGNEAGNLMSLCRSCHEWIHEHEIGDK